MLDSSPSKTEDGKHYFSPEERKEINAGEARRKSINYKGTGLARPKIMTLNASGYTSHKTKPVPTAKMRKLLLLQILEATFPDLVLLQEVLWADFMPHVRLQVGEREYRYIGLQKEAGLLYDSAQFDFEEHTLDTSSWNMDPYGSDLARHFVFGVFTPKGDLSATPPFIALSFHGVHKGDRKGCTDALLKLCATMHDSSDWSNLPIFFGGDFNLDLENDAELPSNMFLCLPDKNRKFDRCIDWLLSSSPSKGYKECRIIECQTLTYYMAEGGMLDPSKFSSEQWKKLEAAAAEAEKEMKAYALALDHDGVSGYIELEAD